MTHFLQCSSPKNEHLSSFIYHLFTPLVPNLHGFCVFFKNQSIRHITSNTFSIFFIIIVAHFTKAPLFIFVAKHVQFSGSRSCGDPIYLQVKDAFNKSPAGFLRSPAPFDFPSSRSMKPSEQ